MSGIGSFSSLAVSGDDLHISYYNETDKDLVFIRSPDGGATWPDGRKSVDTTGDVGWFTSIGLSGSVVLISYYDSTNGNLKIARSIDGGVTW
jgi:hypothetical protein